MTRLFTHEIFRVFYDRLVDEADGAWLFRVLKDVTKQFFQKDFDKLFGHLKQEGRALQEEDLRSLLFGDYMVADAEGDDRRGLKNNKKITDHQKCFTSKKVAKILRLFFPFGRLFPSTRGSI